MIPRLVLVAFLLGHAAIHTGFVSPRPAATAGGPAWPFDLERSWLLSTLGLDGEAGRLLGIALVAVTLAGFGLAAVAALGLLPTAVWQAAITIGAVASIAVLALFFHPWLVLGIAIDVALLWAVLAARWLPAVVAQ